MTERRVVHYAAADRELPDDYRREWTVQVAAERQRPQQQTQSIFVFRIGAEWLAFPVAMLQAVVGRRTVHTVPHHRDGLLLGLVTLRGQLMLCVSLAKLLGVTESSDTGPGAVHGAPRLLIIGIDDNAQLVVPVDDVYGIVRYANDAVRELPPTLASGARYTTNLVLWNDRTIACLDGTLVLYAIEQALA
jgi:chemotaxis-related protein WspD